MARPGRWWIGKQWDVGIDARWGTRWTWRVRGQVAYDTETPPDRRIETPTRCGNDSSRPQKRQPTDLQAIATRRLARAVHHPAELARETAKLESKPEPWPAPVFPSQQPDSEHHGRRRYDRWRQRHEPRGRVRNRRRDTWERNASRLRNCSCSKSKSVFGKGFESGEIVNTGGKRSGERVAGEGWKCAG